MNVTQPAVSRQISEIERLLESPIVRRERNRLFLNPLGARLAEHAQGVLQQLRRAEFDFEAMRKGLGGQVSVGVVTSLAPILMPDAIAMIKQTAPQATISIREGHFVSLLPALQSGAIDLLIARAWQRTEIDGIQQIELMHEPLCVVAGHEHPLASAEAVDWPEAMRWPWILPEAESVAGRAVEAFFSAGGLPAPRDRVISLSLPLNVALMRKMPYLALFPRQLALQHARRGELALLPLDTGDMLSTAQCYWRSGQPEANGTMELFLNCLRRVCQLPA